MNGWEIIAIPALGFVVYYAILWWVTARKRR